MSQPSMKEAEKIRDVVARHAYVFDNGLSSPDFYDLDKRMESEEFSVLSKHIDPDEQLSILEIGCFTGLNLLGLKKRGCKASLTGIDFVEGALKWLREQCGSIGVSRGTFPG